MKKKGIRYEKAKRSIYTGGTKQKDGYAGIGGEHCWNVILSLFKLIAGIVGHSGAMISDAVHSASDVFQYHCSHSGSQHCQPPV